MNHEELKKKIEVLLFASPEPLSINSIKRSLGIPEESIIRDAIDELMEEYYSEKGLFIETIQGGYQIFTKPEYEHLIKKLTDEERKYNISGAALEVLAIVSVFQPVTKPEIESIRGISSDGVIKHLVEMELLKIQGRLRAPGRPILYATTPEFLNYFHLADNKELKNLYKKYSKKFETEEKENENYTNPNKDQTDN